MAAPLTDDEVLRATVAVWLSHEGRTKDAAQAAGVNYETFRSRLKRAQVRGFHLSPGVQRVVALSQLHPGEAQGGWLHVYDEGGRKQAATYWRPPVGLLDDHAERIRAVLSDLPPAPPVALTADPDTDLLTLVPVADAHIGLMAWGRETGEDWDTRKGAERLVGWISRVLAMLAPSHKCILLFAGDLLHADDTRSETPGNRNRLDTDTRHFRTVEMCVEAIARATDIALLRHREVVLRFLPGNHDPHAYLAVMFAIGERYRESPRVRVQRDPSEFYAHQFGQVLIVAHHGHRAKAPQMVHFIADEYAPLWGQTRYRYLFTGHLHHHKSQDIGGVVWEQLPALTARDAYAVSHAYTARARLLGITYHRERGEVARAVVGPAE